MCNLPAAKGIGCRARCERDADPVVSDFGGLHRRQVDGATAGDSIGQPEIQPEGRASDRFMRAIPCLASLVIAAPLVRADTQIAAEPPPPPRPQQLASPSATRL